MNEKDLKGGERIIKKERQKKASIVRILKIEPL